MANLFISWSGPRAEKMAEILREWIPQVIQAVEPWLSGSDIDKGARWNEELGKQLNQASLGIFCLTRDNLESPWLNFEAGALSKTIDASRVCTYLLDLQRTDVPYPLAQFNATRAEKDDTRKLMDTINKALGLPIKDDKILDKAFETYWPELQEQLEDIPEPAEEQTPRDEGEMIREILELVRGLAQRPETHAAFPEWKAGNLPLPGAIDSFNVPQRVMPGAAEFSFKKKSAGSGLDPLGSG